MKFSLLITAAPQNSEAAATALRFAQASLQSGHSIYRIFFFRDGVHNTNTYSVFPQDEVNIPAAWQQFCREQQLDAVTCISAAIKRGIIDHTESQRWQRSGANAASDMAIGGLGLPTEAIIHSDRLVTFG